MMQATGKLATQRDPGNAFRGQSSTFTASDVVKIICLAGAIREDCFHQVVGSCASSWFFSVVGGGLAEKENDMVLRQNLSMQWLCTLFPMRCFLCSMLIRVTVIQLHNFRSGWS